MTNGGGAGAGGRRWRWRWSSSVGDVGAAAAVAALVVDDEQHDAQEEADGAHGDVGDAQEGVLAAHPGDGAQDHPLPALEAAHRVVWEGSGGQGPGTHTHTPPTLTHQVVLNPE